MPKAEINPIQEKIDFSNSCVINKIDDEIDLLS